MAITFTDGGATVTFDSGWEVVRVLVVSFVVGVCMGALLTVYRPALADRLFGHVLVAVAATFRLIKSLLVFPAAMGWA